VNCVTVITRTTLACMLRYSVSHSRVIHLFIYIFISERCNIQHMQDTAVQSKSEWCNKTQ